MYFFADGFRTEHPQNWKCHRMIQNRRLRHADGMRLKKKQFWKLPDHETLENDIPRNRAEYLVYWKQMKVTDTDNKAWSTSHRHFWVTTSKPSFKMLFGILATIFHTHTQNWFFSFIPFINWLSRKISALTEVLAQNVYLDIILTIISTTTTTSKFTRKNKINFFKTKKSKWKRNFFSNKNVLQPDRILLCEVNVRYGHLTLWCLTIGIGTTNWRYYNSYHEHFGRR